MSPSVHPDSRALLADATLTPEAVEGCQGRLTAFPRRYLPRSYRIEHRAHARAVIRGPPRGLGRKTCEPIASEAGLHRKTIQTPGGAGARDDEAVLGELRPHVREGLAEPDGVVVIDPGAFPEKGAESCGVARQWCGRLGEVDNGQVAAGPARWHTAACPGCRPEPHRTAPPGRSPSSRRAAARAGASSAWAVRGC
ncbi:MAG TPA: transposase [Isosphaeraceae bacterium]|nr:transposase [Isosphaeraceae bacterium]